MNICPKELYYAAFHNEFGLDQGYIYMSCGDADAAFCAPEDTALLYGTEDDEWLDWFDDESAWDIDEDFDWDDWGIDWDDYEDFEEEGDEGDGYVCAPPEYPLGSFEAYSLDLDTTVLVSPYCTYDADEDHYVCSNTCADSQYHFQTNVVYDRYPYPHENSCQEEPPHECVDYMGTGYCDYLCD